MDGRCGEPGLEEPDALDAPGGRGPRYQGIRGRPHRLLPCALSATSGPRRRSKVSAQLAETDHDWSRAVHFYRLALTTAVNDAVMSASLRALLSACGGAYNLR